jgi:hypothetical protein
MMKFDRIAERSPTLNRLQGLSDRLSARPTVVALTVITLLVGLYFFPVIFRPGKMFFGLDIVGLHYVFEHYVAQSIRSGRLPHWNPYLFSGYPALAHPQYLVFYPPQMLLRFLPTYRSISWAIIFHFWIAGLGMYALGRRLKLHPWIALACGLAFALNGALILRAYAGHVWLVYALAWVPLAWLLVTIAIEDRHLVATMGAGAVVALIILTGHPTFPAYILAFLSLYGGYLSLQARLEKGIWRHSLGALARLAAIFALGLALSAIQLVPTAFLAPHASLSSGYGLEQANEYALSLNSLLTFLIPNILGDPVSPSNWERVAYVGVLPVLALPFAVMRKDAKPLTWFLAFVAVFGIWLAFGKAAGLYALSYRLFPPFRILRIPPRALVIVVPVLIVLGGLGLQSLIEGSLTTKQIRLSAYAYRNLISLGLGTFAGFVLAWQVALPQWLLAGLVLLLICLIVAGITIPRFNRVAGWPVGIISFAVGLLLGSNANHALAGPAQSALAALGIFMACFLAGIGIVLIFALRLAKASGAVGLLIGLLIFLDMYVYGIVYVHVTDPVQAPIADAEAVPHAYQGRLYSTDGYLSRFDTANQFMLSETGVLSGYDSLQLSDYAAFVRVSGLDDRALDFLNVTHFISFGESESSTTEGYLHRPDFTLTHNPDAQPRAFWVGDSEIANSVEEAGRIINNPDFSYRETVVLSETVEAEPGPGSEEPIVTITGFDAPRGQIVVETTTSYPGVLVMSEPYYVERHAWLDGQEVPLLKANIAFSAVALPAGHHIVELRYVPTAFYVGLGITSVTLVAVSGILLYLAVHKRRMASLKPGAGNR